MSGCPSTDLGGRTWRLEDRIGRAAYDRDGDGLRTQGLFLDLVAWNYHIFEVK